MYYKSQWCDTGKESWQLFFSGELKMFAKHATMGCFTLKYPELDQQVKWFSGSITFVIRNLESIFAELNDVVFQCVGSKDPDWSEMHCCHYDFVTCHKNGTAIT